MDDDETNHDENIITIGGEENGTLHTSQSLLKDLGLELSSVRDSQEKILAYKEN